MSTLKGTKHFQFLTLALEGINKIQKRGKLGKPKKAKNKSPKKSNFGFAGQGTKQKGLKPTCNPRVVFLKAETFP